VDDPGGCLAWAFLPLRRYADFGGRSRRTELVTFYLLVLPVGFALSFAAFLSSSATAVAAAWLMHLALLCPSVALAVRRLHDTGRSGWWTLLALPAVAQGIWQASDPGAPGLEDAAALADLAGFALFVLLMWKDDPEPNRYGPNPRFDAPGPEAQGLE
jgi:uncharacterized membrane protein YhaH (DUF805 family)